MELVNQLAQLLAQLSADTAGAAVFVCAMLMVSASDELVDAQQM